MDNEKIPLVFSEKIMKKEDVGEGTVEDKNEFATYPHKCPKCGFGKAQVIDLGVWYGDEDNVIRMKCGKCGFADQLDAKVM